ncbi:MAG: oligosaccharide flippase family protein [Deltaproteobacteria bacterium]|nr:oligosaccharide flippase family protein [Deltaproteobacteria bacterium]
MSLGRRAVRQTLWVAGGTYLKTSINFLANILLMRLIAPDQFGILAMAMFFLTLARKLVGFGFNHALVHQQDDLHRHVPTHLWLNAGLGVFVAVAAAFARPLVASQYDAATADALLLLAVFGLLESIGHTPRLLLEKELKFDRLIRLDLVNTVASNLVGIACALSGWGWTALAAKQITAWAIQTAGTWRLHPTLPGWRPCLRSARWYWAFGLPMWSAGIATFISLQFDDFLVGSFSGNEALGYYGRAYALASFPTVMVTHIVGRVAFPLYARVQHDRDALSNAFARVVRVIITLTAPGVLWLAVCAPELVSVVFGPDWTGMIAILQLLVIYAFLRPVYDNCGELFTAVGQPKVASRILIAQAVAVLIACPPMTWAFGASGAAIAVGGALAVGVVRAYQIVPRYVNFSAIRAFGPATVAALAGVASAFAGARLLGDAGPIAVIAAKTLAFVAVYAAVLFAIEGRQLREDWREFRMSMSGGESD